uniref:G-protein coupled receptors family 1 profile domain-containing protein n=1 Tax=Moschus moschiferus TaxID=68415 RepID=A0A8C6DE48_MOSMO
MDKENCTAVTDFILLGFSDAPELRVFLFLLFLSIYGATVLGNLGMIVLIESPLVLCGFCYSMTIAPKFLASVLNEDKAISFLGCAVQFYLFCTFGVTEVILLAVMAYDRFVAICDPLLYMVTMFQNLCMELVSCCYLSGAMRSVIHLCLALQIPSYRLNVINHFLCDLPPLLSLACSDVTVSPLVLYVVATFYEIITIMVILKSYVFILIIILRMHSAEGRCKAFSTCASHLTAIAVFHGTILFIYCKFHSGNSMGIDKVTTVLRNKDVKEVLRKVEKHSVNLMIITSGSSHHS